MAIRVVYHREGDVWWADSPDLDGFVATGADLAEVRALVKEGVPFYVVDDDVELEEQAPWASGVVVTYSSDDVWRDSGRHGLATGGTVSVHGVQAPLGYAPRPNTRSVNTPDNFAAAH